MLLLHQVGSVKIGEVIRYTVTYTPAHDRILPSPEVLHLRIRNTSNLALRAAFVHGPYALNVAAYPAHFDPNVKFDKPERYGVPEFEPQLKAGGTWTCQLIVPDNIRHDAGTGAMRGDFGDSDLKGRDGARGATKSSASWVVEVASQVIFSSSATVGYDVMLARDEKSLRLGLGLGSGSSFSAQAAGEVPQPGRVSDHQESIGAKDGHHPAQSKGVFSKAITLLVEDTASLWNTPRLPGWDDHEQGRPKWMGDMGAAESVLPGQDEEPRRKKARKLKRVHLVVLTHGLHSNLSGDMLYMKESIDATVAQAKVDARARRAREKAERNSRQRASRAQATEGEATGSEAEKPAGVEDKDDKHHEDEDEEVIVRGFSGNATRTERGIKYLGKRLARYILSMTYPTQPFLPAMKGTAEHIITTFKAESEREAGRAVHKRSTIVDPQDKLGKLDKQDMKRRRPFQISSISFIGHSLGGLVQMYAIAYIQKHSPDFFTLIRPVNFICLASPLLGLSNENPLYVKFALDFGFVGRTGQDLGLTWRAPTLARSGWGALVGSLGESAHKKVMGESQTESKPLLRILPTGPAHMALKKFRNRTVYSNVVNDGIVPLRTSCLLFLDWQGLGRVEKARREAGLVGSVLGFGWAELTGANATARRGPWSPRATTPRLAGSERGSTMSEPDAEAEDGREVPQPASDAMVEDNRTSISLPSSPYQESRRRPSVHAQTNNSPLSGWLNLFRAGEGQKTARERSPQRSPKLKQVKIYKRSQTVHLEDETPTAADADADAADAVDATKSTVTSGHELKEQAEDGVTAPPRTSVLDSAVDLLNPRLPTVEYLIDPSCRPRAIFHDRVYHPSDIPPPPVKKATTAQKPASCSPVPSSSAVPQQSPLPAGHHDDGTTKTDPTPRPDHVVDSSNMRVEEKIARAYHKGLSWRKVLVKLEPDAHNNIIVRRMFANAHGWPVVKHLCDAHFSDSVTARLSVDEQASRERAKAMNEPPDETGAETRPIDPLPNTPTAATAAGPAPSARPPGQDVERERPDVVAAADQAAATSPSVVDLLQPAPSRTDSEMREAQDSISALPDDAVGRGAGPASGTGPYMARAAYHSTESLSWSDRDWLDSGDDSDSDDRDRDRSGAGAGANPNHAWNWTEKIVGKGAGAAKKARRPAVPPRSPRREGGVGREGEDVVGPVPVPVPGLEEASTRP